MSTRNRILPIRVKDVISSLGETIDVSEGGGSHAIMFAKSNYEIKEENNAESDTVTIQAKQKGYRSLTVKIDKNKNKVSEVILPGLSSVLVIT